MPVTSNTLCAISLALLCVQAVFAQDTSPRVIRVTPQLPYIEPPYTAEDYQEDDRQRVYESARNAWYKAGSLDYEKKSEEALASFEESVQLLRASKYGYNPQFGKLLGQRYAKCLRRNGRVQDARKIEKEFCQLTKADEQFHQISWRKPPEKPSVVPMLPPAPATPLPRWYFRPEVNICGVGIDYSTLYVKDVETTEDAINKTYTLYRSDDLKREHPAGMLEVKNGNGFLDNFNNELSIEEAKKLWGESALNIVHERPEDDCLVFNVIGIESAATPTEAKDFRIYLDDSRIRRYVVDGPGILFVDVKDAEPTYVLQYVQGGLNRAYASLKPLSKSPGTSKPQDQTIGMRLDQQLKSGEGVTVIEPPKIEWSSFSSHRSERHQKTSPTFPDGAPIPDSR